MIGPIPARALLMTIGKAAITITAIVIIFRQIDFSFLLSHRHQLSAFTLVATLVLLACQTSLMAGVRLKLVLEALGPRRRLEETVQVALSGFFFEQVAFGFVGGDAMRLWLLHRTDIPLRTAVEAIVIDRFLGSIALLLLALVGLPGLISLLTGYRWQVIVSGGAVLAVAAAIVIVLVVRFGKRPRTPFLAEIVNLASSAVRKPEVRRRIVWAFLLAVLAQLMNVLIFFMLGRDLGIDLNLGHWFLIVPPALLISMLPISAGGWGLREASFVVALASFAIRPEEAVIPPIVFGLAVLLVTLPGGVIWLVQRKRASRKQEPAAATPGEASTSDADEDRLARVSAGVAVEPKGGYRQRLMRLG